jgi:hypothetical protein|tara:strand:- start:672 stop:1010 length:339 start_codon:yes stop_codon:yes gene_type:complete
MIVCVNIHGNEVIAFDLDDLQAADDDHMFIENKMDRSGGLSQAVRQAILNKGYIISYVGCGITGWDLGVALDPEGAEVFEEFMVEKFKKAIKYEMIVVTSWVTGENEGPFRE